MHHEIFSIYDSKADAYISPFFLPTKAQALRAFGDCCHDENHQFGKHPEDYMLVHLGTFDDSAGIISVLEYKKAMCIGIELINKTDETIPKQAI